MGIEPTSSAWKADALTVVLYPQKEFIERNESSQTYDFINCDF